MPLPTIDEISTKRANELIARFQIITRNRKKSIQCGIAFCELTLSEMIIVLHGPSQKFWYAVLGLLRIELNKL